jgi:predicted ribosome quality control (RQC) complex YloA/Tae2 family protein
MCADGDMWMHARGVPGSHLIIRVPAGQQPSVADIQFAANLSVFFSKARESPRWDVTVCSGKDLKKPKGAKPGQVLVIKESVVSGKPHESAAAKNAGGVL